VSLRIRATMLRAVLASLCLLSTSELALAGAAPANPCGPNSTPEQCICDRERPRPAVHLPEIRESAMAVRAALCEDRADLSTVLARLGQFVRRTRTWFDAYGGFVDDAAPNTPINVNDEIVDIIDAGRGVPPANVTLRDQLQVVGSGKEIVLVPRDPAICKARAASASASATCVDVLDEFEEFYNYAQATYASESALAFARYVAALREDWEDYLNNGRSQTLPELLVNSYLYRRNEDAQFDPPPDWQWIVLHPDLVLEYVGDADDGEQFNEGLMVELGANNWRQHRWYLPSGGAIIAMYSDRSEVSDWGYGVALHFANVYTLGVSRRSGDTGYFVSVDLLKLAEDKKKILGKFRR